MNCVIVNKRRVYIKITEDGRIDTCSERDRTVMDERKAKNILKSLPRTLKNLKFHIEYIPDEINPAKSEHPERDPNSIVRFQLVDDNKNKSEQNQTSSKKKQATMKNDEYEIPENISRWLDKFGMCDDVIKEARNRMTELESELDHIHKKMCDTYHVIEFHKKADMYTAWKIYKTQNELLMKRRYIKDEYSILSDVLKGDFSVFERENMKKRIDALNKRTYVFRVVEDNADDLQKVQ